MSAYEYKVVPAPKTGIKAKGVKTTQDRFAYALETIMNPLGAEGWDYVRTDTLPCEERVGFTGRRTEFQNMLVFRRAIGVATAEPAAQAPKALAVPVPVQVPVPASAKAEPADTRVSDTLNLDRQEPQISLAEPGSETAAAPRVAAE